MGKNYSYYNLIGGLNTRDGVGTINATPKQTESPEMLNIEFYKNGGLKSMNGNKRFSITQFESPGSLEKLSITLGYEYVLNNKKNLIVTTSDGSLWKYDSTIDEFRLLYKFPNESSRHSIIGFNYGIVVSNGIDDLVYYRDDQSQKINLEVNIVANSNIATVTGEVGFTGQILPGDYVYLDNEEGNYPVASNSNRENELFYGYEVEAVSSDGKQITFKNTFENEYTGYLTLGKFAKLNATYVPYDTTEETAGTPLPVRGLAIQSYQGRIFVGGNDGTIYYSEIGLIHGWSGQYGAGAIPTFYNDNSDFTALAPWDKYLVLFKRERSYLLDGTDIDDANWSIEPYSNYTCDSQQSYIDINNGLYIYSRVGGGIFPMLQRTIYSANYQGTETSLKIREVFDLLNTELYDRIFPVFNPKKKFLCFYVPLATGLGSNDCYILDLNAKAWLHRRVPQYVTIAFRFNDKTYIGTNDGLILEEFVETTFDGEAIEFSWKSPWITFGQGSNYLSTREFRVNMAENENNKYHVRVRRNGEDDFKKRQVTNNQNNKEALIWDIGYNRDDLNPNYTDKLTVYEIKDLFDNIFYTKYPHLASPPPEDIGQANAVVSEYMGIYTANTVLPRDFIGYASEYTALIETDKDDSEAFEVDVAVQGYKYTYSHKQYVRYTNGTDYVWIPWIDKVPKVNQDCKMSKDTTSKTKIAKGFNIYTFGKKKIVTVYAFYDDSFNGVAQFADKTPINNKKLDNTSRLYNILLINSLKGPVKATGPDDVKVYLGTTSWQEVMSGTPGTGESLDLYETTGASTGNDITLASDGVVEYVEETTTNTYTITVNGNTFTDMVIEDGILEGDDLNKELYTKEILNTNIDAYEDSEFIIPLGIGVDTNSITLDSNNENVDVTEAGSFFYTIQKYQKYITVFYTYTGNNTEQQDPQKLILYQPTEKEYTDSITGTTWDNNNWVANRQILKRFPLPNQYFETLQIEFYGNTVEEALCLNGFEFHGVELEEVPYR